MEEGIKITPEFHELYLDLQKKLEREKRYRTNKMILKNPQLGREYD